MFLQFLPSPFRRLDGTQIKELPSKYGMQNIRELDLKNTPNLFTILNPENFENIRNIKVTYAYHCCAFRGERKQLSLGISNDSRPCNTSFTHPTTSSTTAIQNKVLDKHEQIKKMFKHIFDAYEPPKGNIDLCSMAAELFSEPFNNLIKCDPEPDAFTPCEDVLGTNLLRVCSWIISIFAIIGNMLQLIILFCNRDELTVYKLLMYNLGFSNLLMGVYLMMLCCVDAHTYGEYYNYVQAWQYAGGCQVLGFIGMFATQLSLCILVLITVERFLLITYAVQIEKQMRIQHAKFAVLLSWLYSLVVAFLPATNKASSFNRTAVCLPLDLSSGSAVGYIVWLLSTYITGFLAILGCYVILYRSIYKTTVAMETRTMEIQVAKRLSMIIFSNFLCWLPISIAGFMALYSNVDFNVRVAKFLLVFFFPLNACTNPFLYAIFTKVFREDLLTLLSSCKFFNQCIKWDSKRGRAPSYIKSMKERSNTETLHLHMQSPLWATNVNRNRDIEEILTDFESPETPMKLSNSSDGKDSKCNRFNESSGKPRSGSTRGLLEAHRCRSESNETTCTKISGFSEEENFSDLIGSVKEDDPSILRV